MRVALWQRLSENSKMSQTVTAAGEKECRVKSSASKLENRVLRSI